MPWHAEPIVLTLRRYNEGDSYENRDRFASTATAHLLGGGRAFVCAFLNDGSAGRISRHDWLDLAVLLREDYGVRTIEAERHTQPTSFNTDFGGGA